MIINQIAEFITHLINAGMAIDEAVKQGYVLALELSAIQDGFLLLSKQDQMIKAAERLESAAVMAGVSLNQQQAYARNSSKA